MLPPEVVDKTRKERLRRENDDRPALRLPFDVPAAYRPDETQDEETNRTIVIELA